MLKVMKAADILGLVDTPGGDIVLLPLGKKFLESDINERKSMLRERLLQHGLFNYLVRLVKGQEDDSIDKEQVLEHLAMLLPNEDPERLFSTIVNWGRFAELFGYNKDEERFYLDQE
jgi:NitT/TauT family transport system ATP-binding protein